ncbi:MAG: hypothetical protein PHY92_02770 [Alphaproteobacteria bacterium]|nr:hypothetical protein [Alphaproteobacteria bacterium]
MSSTADSLLPYNVLRLGLPSSTFRLASEAYGASGSSVQNQLRLLATGGSLTDVLTSTLPSDFHEQVFIGYTSGAVLITRAMSLKSDVLV